MNDYPEYPETNDQVLKDDAEACDIHDFSHAKCVREYARTIALWRECFPDSIKLLKKLARSYGTEIEIERDRRK
jgi:hypothetical protein